MPSTSQVNFVSRALLTNGKKQTKRNSPVRKLAEPSRQVRETWHRHAAARPGRARVAGEGSKLRATPRLPSSGAPRGGGPHTSARFLRPRRQRPRPPPAVPVAAPRGARSFVPPKSQGGRGPRQAAPRPPARRSATRHKARRGEAGRIRQGSADPGQAGAGPSPRARPGWGPGGCSTHPGEEALPELDPLQALYVEHGGARPKGLTAAAGSLLLAPSTHPVPSQAVTSARHSDLT